MAKHMGNPPECDLTILRFILCAPAVLWVPVSVAVWLAFVEHPITPNAVLLTAFAGIVGAAMCIAHALAFAMPINWLETKILLHRAYPDGRFPA